MKNNLERKPIKVEKLGDVVVLTNEAITSAKTLDNPNKLSISQIFLKNNGECMIGSPEQIKKSEALKLKIDPKLIKIIIEKNQNLNYLNQLFSSLHATLNLPTEKKKIITYKALIENYAKKLSD